MPQSHCLVKVVTCRSSKAEGSIDMTTFSACMKLCMRAVQEVQLVTLDTHIPQRQKWRKSTCLASYGIAGRSTLLVESS